MLLTYVLLVFVAFFRYRSTADRVLSRASTTFARRRRAVRLTLIFAGLALLFLVLAGNTECGSMYLKHTDLEQGVLLGLDGNGN